MLFANELDEMRRVRRGGYVQFFLGRESIQKGVVGECIVCVRTHGVKRNDVVVEMDTRRGAVVCLVFAYGRP